MTSRDRTPFYTTLSVKQLTIKFNLKLRNRVKLDSKDDDFYICMEIYELQ